MSIAFALSMLSLEGFNMSSDCFQKNDQVRLAAYVNMGLAAVHMFFAIYIQFKLIRDFNGSEGEEPTAMQGGQGWALAKRMWHIILYDFVFCLYVPVALGSFGFGFYQFGGAHACSTDGHKGSAAAWFAGVFLVCYGWMTVAYLMCWSCYVACCGLSERTIQQFKDKTGRGNPSGEQGSRLSTQLTGGITTAVAQPVIAQAPVAAPMPAAGP